MSANYNYLELVNGVLVRLREDTVTSVNGNDDVVVELVKEFVNDAKQQVENAHVWTALSYEWSFSTSVGQSVVTVPDSNRSSVIDYVYDADGIKLNQAGKEYVRKNSLAAGTATNEPRVWCLDGVDATSSNLKLKLYPTPATVRTYTVYGYQATAKLVNDTDDCLLPGLPIIYLATALAARERGEVGGQSAGELMALAKQYMMDSIAQDSTNSDLENIWTTI